MTTKRGSTSIGPKQTAGGFHAVRFATASGRQMNLLATIDLTTLGINDNEAGTLFRKLWQRTTRWWAYERSKGRPLGSFAALATHENPPGGPRHVHWLMHVPPKAANDVQDVIGKRLRKLTGMDCAGKALHFERVRKPGGVAKYMLKGVHPAFASHFHMVAVDQGVITGRRLAVSRSIGATARRNAGWRRKKQR